MNRRLIAHPCATKQRVNPMVITDKLIIGIKQPNGEPLSIFLYLDSPKNAMASVSFGFILIRLLLSCRDS
jgi:hypothetical protein